MSSMKAVCVCVCARARVYVCVYYTYQVNMSSMKACRVRMVEGGAGEAAVAVIRACEGGAGHSKNHLIALQIVQNLSAHADTGELLIAQVKYFFHIEDISYRMWCVL